MTAAGGRQSGFRSDIANIFSGQVSAKMTGVPRLSVASGMVSRRSQRGKGSEMVMRGLEMRDWGGRGS